MFRVLVCVCMRIDLATCGVWGLGCVDLYKGCSYTLLPPPHSPPSTLQPRGGFDRTLFPLSPCLSLSCSLALFLSQCYSRLLVWLYIGLPRSRARNALNSEYRRVLCDVILTVKRQRCMRHRSIRCSVTSYRQSVTLRFVAAAGLFNSNAKYHPIRELRSKLVCYVPYHLHTV